MPPVDPGNPEPTSSQQPEPAECKQRARVRLCSGCRAEVPPLTDFCPKCSMPVGTYTTLDPFKQIQAQGWGFRKALRGRVSTFTFVGIWLIFGPTVVFGVASVLANLLVAFDEVLWETTLLAAWTTLCALILYLVTRGYIRTRRHKRGYCFECGYDLRELPEPRCPECGTRFDPEEVERELKNR